MPNAAPHIVNPLGRLDSIQALRGVAAMLVLLFHIAELQRQFLTAGSAEYELTRGFWDRGGNGVDLFFVISGFIMVYVTRDTVPSLATARQFLWARATRIYPLWWVCAGIMTGYFWVSYGIPAAPDRIAGPSEAWRYAIKSFALFPQEAPPMLGVGWTLIHEMFFYLVFAVSLLFARRRLIWILFGWAALTFMTLVVFGPANSFGAIYKVVANPMSIEFIGGAVTGILFVKWQEKQISLNLCYSLAVCSVIFIFIIMYSDFQFKWADQYLSRTLVYTVPMSMLVFALLQLEIRGRLSIPRWLRTLGDWSYSLYLTHFIVFVSMRRILRMGDPYMSESMKDLILTERAGALNNIVYAIIAIVLCLITAAIFYKFIERPSLAYFRRLSAKRELKQA